MAKKFFTRTTKAKGICPLYIQIARRSPKLHIVLCTGIDVDIATWNRVSRTDNTWRNFIMTEEGKELNDKLVLIEKVINQLIDDGRVSTNQDKDVIVEAIRPIVNVDLIDHQAEMERKRREEAELRKRSIIGFYEYFLAGINDGTIRHGDNRTYSHSSIKEWFRFGTFLRGYVKNKSMTFDEITKPFADKFFVYLDNSGSMQSTKHLIISKFCKLCNYAAEEGINTNAVSLKVWKSRRATAGEKHNEIYLTSEELDAMYNMELTGIEEHVRDLFLLGCLTCQRYSDYRRLKKDNFKTLEDGTQVVCLTQKKTGTYVEIPIFDNRINDICSKYNYAFPVYNIDTFDKVIKEIGRKLSKSIPTLAEKQVCVIGLNDLKKENRFAEICKKVEAEKGKINGLTIYERRVYSTLSKYAKENNGQPLWERNAQGEVLRCKWELITSHTARRSGVTNLYKTDLLNSREIMSISGHQTEETFKMYIRVGTSEQASRIAAKFRKDQEAQEASNIVELKKAE
jgi:integrase